MEKFTWGHTFLEINRYVTRLHLPSCISLALVIIENYNVFLLLSIIRELLDKYAACKDSNDVINTQNEWLNMLEDEVMAKQKRKEKKEARREDGTSESDDSDSGVCSIACHISLGLVY